eukprot:TRINITY_DN7452_c0_g1_i1.p1 TRINITY_DN7452_c0_g1~~TRINITY_DN7452_c0_g1_i1.p1  ORF type:complete len:901 (+),score=274.81 TRINITY_DN7452_c0_g1_i1:141-2843(+)
MSWFFGGGGDSGGGNSLSTVELQQLLIRLQDATNNVDRKKTIATIKDSSLQAHKKALGQAIPIFVNELKVDREDAALTRDTIEILIEIMTPKTDNATQQNVANSEEAANAEIFVKDTKNVSIILDLLEERDPSVRYQITQLLRLLLSSRASQLQQAILVSPMGIARLMDLLRDNRELVRNEALLLLLGLTKSNQEIQKIITFEGAFEILLNIIYEEGLSDGSIVVQDCLQLINNLLKGNVSNQNYFRETSCIKKLPPLLQLARTDMWILTDDKIQILLLTMELISLLVAGNDPSTTSNQNVLASQNILGLIIPLALGRVNSVTIRTKALRTLGDLVNGNKQSCNTFSVLTVVLEAPTGGSQTQPALSRLLTVVLNAKDFSERIAAVRVFKCFLYENEESQMALASTLTPPPTMSNEEMDSASIGTQLIKALGTWENNDEILPYKSWFSSLILSFIIKENSTSKELVLRIPLEIPTSGVPMVTLLTKCMRSLTFACRIVPSEQTLLAKIGFLRLLSTWLDNSAAAVKAFLSFPNNLPFLMELVIAPSENTEGAKHIQGLSGLLVGLCILHNEDSGGQFTKTALHALITQRIGVEPFLDKLDQLRKTEHFIRAEQGKTEMEQSPEPGHESTLNFYDYDFTVFYKSAFDKIQRQLKSPTKMKKTADKEVKEAPPTNPPPVADAYHETVLKSYKELIRQQDVQLENSRKTIADLEAKIKQLEVAQLRSLGQPSANQDSENVQQQLQDKNAEIQRLTAETESLRQQNEINGNAAAELQSLAQACTDLQRLNDHKDEEIDRLKAQLQSASSTTVQPTMAAEPNIADETLLRKVAELESFVQSLSLEKETLQSTIGTLEARVKDEQDRYSSLEKEQDDLLMELANAETENSNLKAQLSLIGTETETF